MDNRPAKTRITAEELLSELAEAYRPRTRESLRKDGWISKLDLIDMGLEERTARRVLDEKMQDAEKRAFKVEGVQNRIHFYRLKAKTNGSPH